MSLWISKGKYLKEKASDGCLASLLWPFFHLIHSAHVLAFQRQNLSLSFQGLQTVLFIKFKGLMHPFTLLLAPTAHHAHTNLGAFIHANAFPGTFLPAALLGSPLASGPGPRKEEHFVPGLCGNPPSRATSPRGAWRPRAPVGLTSIRPLP